jgi:SecD/SecF fusion protein
MISGILMIFLIYLSEVCKIRINKIKNIINKTYYNMQNKGAIRILAIAFALVSLYQLYFTYKTKNVENDAREYAKGDARIEAAYLDSISSQPVYNFFGITEFTYKQCKELELNLGLDLKGGMNVTMEVDVVDLIKSLANHTSDPSFTKAINDAKKMQEDSQDDFVTLFARAFEQGSPGAQLSSPDIFGNFQLKDKIQYGASNKEVI